MSNYSSPQIDHQGFIRWLKKRNIVLNNKSQLHCCDLDLHGYSFFFKCQGGEPTRLLSLSEAEAVIDQLKKYVENTNPEFIQLSKAVHKEHLDKSLAIRAETSVSLFCEDRCTSEGVYLVSSVGTGLYKIGYSRNPKTRLHILSKEADTAVSLVHVIETSFTKEIEALLHKSFESKRIKGEWFDLTKNDVKRICALTEDDFLVASLANKSLPN